LGPIRKVFSKLVAAAGVDAPEAPGNDGFGDQVSDGVALLVMQLSHAEMRRQRPT
jgi:hypothetical protein